MPKNLKPIKKTSGSKTVPTIKNLTNWRNTLIAYAQWTDAYCVWWQKKYGSFTKKQLAAKANGSTPPPPPPRVPPQ